jgi:hypothetical protein
VRIFKSCATQDHGLRRRFSAACYRFYPDWKLPVIKKSAFFDTGDFNNA